MLKLIDYRSRAKGLPDLLPYAALVAPGVILNKDGSFLAAWEVRGQDTASSTPEELAFVSAQVSGAVKLLGTGWMLHVDALRSRERTYARPEDSHFPDPVTRLIDEERRQFFSGDAQALLPLVQRKFQRIRQPLRQLVKQLGPVAQQFLRPAEQSGLQTALQPQPSFDQTVLQQMIQPAPG